jgi:sugar O-acyltransferase (sialic acid O-acetyltransferase NeuD family)
MRTLFVLGTGGQARDVGELAAALGYRPVFAARDEIELEGWSGSDEALLEREAVKRTGEAFALGVGDNRLRAKLAAKRRAELSFPSLIHPDTTLARGIADKLASTPGALVFPGVRIMGGCTIGAFTTINLNATVSHDCVVGDFANLSPGSHLAGNVHLGEGAWIGMGAVVNQGRDDNPRRIGAWATIGSGAVVLRDVPDGSVQAGVPAKDLRP